MIAAIDGSQTGDIKTTQLGDQGGRVRLFVAGDRRHAPLPDRQRLDTCMAFDMATGQQLWKQPLGTGAEGAAGARRRQDLCRHRQRQVLHHPARAPTRAQILSEVELPNSATAAAAPRARRSRSSPARPSRAAASSSSRATRVYAIGPRQARAADRLRRRRRRRRPAQARRRICRCRRPSSCSTPGETVQLRARLFDDKGRFLREEKARPGRSRG